MEAGNVTLASTIHWRAYRGEDRSCAPTVLSYATAIGVRIDDETIAINESRFSISTTRQQSTLRMELYWHGYEQVEGPLGLPEAWHPIRELNAIKPREEKGWSIYRKTGLEPITSERRPELERAIEAATPISGGGKRLREEIATAEAILAGIARDRTLWLLSHHARRAEESKDAGVQAPATQEGEQAMQSIEAA
jgi:hypothetical protein